MILIKYFYKLAVITAIKVICKVLDLTHDAIGLFIYFWSKF